MDKLYKLRWKYLQCALALALFKTKNWQFSQFYINQFFIADAKMYTNSNFAFILLMKTKYPKITKFNSKIDSKTAKVQSSFDFYSTWDI